MSDDELGGFTQKETVDKPAIIGARWWQASIANEVPRRKAIKTLLTYGGALGAIGLFGYAMSRRARGPGGAQTWAPEDATAAMRGALDMQKEYGWSFGATGDSLVFDGTNSKPFDPTSLDRLTTDFAPGNAAHTPYFVPTLFQSPNAMPRAKPAGDPDAPPFKPLKDVIIPIHRASMDAAFGRGKALAAVLASSPRGKRVAVIVDLPGPEAVAFAAGAAGALDPVFLFDNWPHPHGVVSSHLTLAAALYYQPLFANARGQAASAPPMFVLDRGRLVNYVDDVSKFDNRYTARVPTADGLSQCGVTDVLYVGPDAVDRYESDDLVDPFVGWQASGRVAFHTVPAMAFELADDGNYYYGGSAKTNGAFWTDWDHANAQNLLTAYTPVPRKTEFSSGNPVSTASSPRPLNFGYVPVMVAVTTGVVLGAKASRSGSWNRTTWTSGGTSS